VSEATGPLTSRRATILAPAKVNLALQVLGRRPDGYHDIDTLFQAVDLCDEVEVEVGGDRVVVEVEGVDLGPQEKNLAYRAAQRFLRQAAVDSGARITLTKRIPLGAGLGGGSSDAAAVLRCLASLIEGVDAYSLHVIAGELGSDVPFFLGESPLARGRGRGEVLEPLPALPAADLVLVSPPVHVSTAEAYAELSATRAEGVQVARLPPSLALRRWPDLERVARNDFEPVIGAVYQEVPQALAALQAAGASVALMTGSGSTCFGLFADAPTARAAAEEIARGLRWRCRPVRTLEAFPEPRRG
jgi:4-diphosphocytidyl-2-C-methyl-D-erythritol kinase